MAKSIQQLMAEGVDPKDIGNVARRRALRQAYQQNYAQQVAQATALNPSGLPQNLPTNYTVTGDDTLSTIAQANGTTEADLLRANPDVKRLRPGMVINTPRPQNYLDSERTYKPNFAAYNQSERGGIGVPSAGPIGGVQGGLSTQQQQGMLAYSQSISQQSRAIPQRFTSPTTGLTQFGNPFAANEYRPPNSNGWNPNAFATPAENIVRQQAGAPTLPVPGVTNPNQPQINPSSTAPRPRQYAPRENLVTLLDSITGQTGPNGRMPNALELKLLEQSGRIVKAGQNTGLYGNYSYSNIKKKQRGRGGGGGGGARPLPGGLPRVGQGDRLPAFSNGAGFGGLVNWRIG